MPIYEYKCDNGHVFEVVQRIAEEALTRCEDCGAPAVRVLYSPAVHFKGSGFYNTDYGKKGSKPAEKTSENSSGSSSEKKSEKKSETKSETKTASAD